MRACLHGARGDERGACELRAISIIRREILFTQATAAAPEVVTAEAGRQEDRVAASVEEVVEVAEAAVLPEDGNDKSANFLHQR